jgi:hypothetical protein
MYQQADFFDRFAGKYFLSAMAADLDGDVLNQDRLAVNLEYFADLFPVRFRRAADVAFEHGYLRFSNSIHSFGSGSYKVMILTISLSMYEAWICSGRPALVKPSSRQLGAYLSCE